MYAAFDFRDKVRYRKCQYALALSIHKRYHNNEIKSIYC